MLKCKLSLFAALFIFSAGFAALRALEIPLKRGAGDGGLRVGFVDMENIYQDYPETAKAKQEYYAELDKRRELLAERDKELADLREQLTVLRTTMMELEAPAAEEPAEAQPEEPAPATSEPSKSERPTRDDWREQPGAEGAANAPSPAPAVSTAAAIVPPEPAAKAPAGKADSAAAMAASLGISTGSVYAVKETILQREKLLKEQEESLETDRQKAVQELKDLEALRSQQIFGKLYRALVQLAEEKGINLVVDKNSILYGQEALDLTDALKRRIRGLPEPGQE